MYVCLSRCGMMHLKFWTTLRLFMKEYIDRFSCFDSDLQNFIKVTYSMPEIYTRITIIKEDVVIFLTIEDGNSLYYSPSIIISLKDVDIFCDTIDEIINGKITV